MIATNLAFNMLASASLSYLWSFVNTLQLIANLPLLSLNIPANLFFIFALISGPLEFNFFDTDYITSKLLGLNEVELEERESYSEVFEDFGYGNDLAVMNL
jgi:hypothetical protein